MSNPFLRFIIHLFIILLVLYIISNSKKLFFNKTSQNNTTEISKRPITPKPSTFGSEEESFIKIFDEMSPSVVSIKNASYQRDFFSLNVYEVPQGVGSGIVWDNQGHIVTNFHVIYNADKIEISFSKGKSYKASIKGVAPDYDLAVLKINEDFSSLNPIPLGCSKELKVGQKVLALGNPFGLDGTLTTGIISALGRTIDSITEHKINDVIQTDAAINPGNSGGPLLDSFGRLIAINTAILSPNSGTYSGIGFAIPIDTVNRIVSQIIQKGKLTRPGLGISLIPNNILKNLKIEGALILNIATGSSASNAGLKGTSRDLFGRIILGDIIIEIDNHKIKNNEDLINVIENNYKVGNEVTIKFIRNRKILETKAILQEI